MRPPARHRSPRWKNDWSSCSAALAVVLIDFAPAQSGDPLRSNPTPFVDPRVERPVKVRIFDGAGVFITANRRTLRPMKANTNRLIAQGVLGLTLTGIVGCAGP